MIKFEDKYVHFRWTEELKGKDCFVSDSIEGLERAFHESRRYKVEKDSSGSGYPFHTQSSQYRFAYYDPNYDCKIAFNEGKQIQGRRLKTNPWRDILATTWDSEYEYRIKPEGLQWTDLKVGDVICKGEMTRMVTGIDNTNDAVHIFASYTWLDDDELAEWSKEE